MLPAKSHIYISFDGRISPNYKSFLGIVTHWTDENFDLCLTLIGLKEVQHTREGINLAKIVKVFQQYGII